METRLVDNFGTCKTLCNERDEVKFSWTIGYMIMVLEFITQGLKSGKYEAIKE